MSELARQLAHPSPTIWLEVSPPKGIDMEPLLRQLQPLAGVIGAINLTDNSMGRAKLSALVFGLTIKQRLGLPVVLNLSCRDRNLLAIKSDLLAAAAYAIDGVVALKGDKLAAAGVNFNELSSADLLRVIGQINAQIASEASPSAADRTLHPGTVANPHRANLAREVELLANKVEAGARFAITQPIFDSEQAMRFLEAIRHLPISPVVGLLPIKRAAMARYLTSNVRELKHVADFLHSYEGLPDEQVRRLTIAHNLKLIELLKPHVAGFVIMSGGGPSLAIQLAIAAARTLAPLDPSHVVSAQEN